MQCGVTEKKEGILFLNDFDFLSVEQKYGEVFLQDLYRKQVSLSLRWWHFDISFAENKNEKKTKSSTLNGLKSTLTCIQS